MTSVKSLFEKHRESQKFVDTLARACTKRTSSCYFYEVDEEKTYEYRFTLKLIIAEPQEWVYELECFDLISNRIICLKVRSLDRVTSYSACSFTSTIINQLSPLVGAWLRMTDEIKQSVGNIAIFTSHRTFRLKSNKPYGLNIPFIRSSRELIYRDDDYSDIYFHVVNGELQEANQELIPLHTSIFEV